ncbi:MAG: alpha/beta fold hydrolase [Polyangiales bacterium]
MQLVEREVEFESQGVRCRGLFVRPEGASAAPLVVLSHGLGGVYEMRLDAFARRFARAGYAALTFDYRYFGRSDGMPRHLLEHAEQQRDIDAAIDFGKTLEGVDARRVVLWGTSLAGGHMIDVSSRRDDLAATIIQAPFTDGVASGLALPLRSALGAALFIVADLAARLFGLRRVLIPLAAPPGLPALMTKPDVVADVLKLMPQGSRMSGRLSALYQRWAARSFALSDNVSTSDLPEPCDVSPVIGSVILPSGTALVNGVSASFGLEILFWRPGKNLKHVRAPILVCVCENDSVAPAKSTVAHARRAPRAELKLYPYNHFVIYRGEPFERVFADQLAFLQRVVPLPGTRDARAAQTT